MIIWIDAQLSPSIANCINSNFPGLDGRSLRSLGLESANDYDIFRKARKARVFIMSKDHDFVKLIEIHKTPPKLIWITCGNTSNSRLCEILTSSLQQAVDLLSSGEDIVEIGDRSGNICLQKQTTNMRNHVFINAFLLLISTGCKQTGTQTVQRPWSALIITEENKEVIKINNYDDTSSAKYYDGGSFSIRYNKVKVDSLKTYFTMAEKDTLFHLAKDIISVPDNIHEYCTDFVGDLKLTIDYGEFKEPGSFRQSGEYSGVCRWDTLSEKTKQLNNILRRRIRWRTK